MIQDWVEQCRNGQTSAYAKLVRALQHRIVNFLYRMTQNRELAEDLGQETFLKGFRLINRYDPKKAAFSTWLFTIARNLCVDELRKKRAGTTGMEEAETVASPSTPYLSANEKELESRIAAAVAKLDPEFREAFVLKEYEDLTLEEISDITGCPVGTVKSRLHRARLELQKRLLFIVKVE